MAKRAQVRHMLASSHERVIGFCNQLTCVRASVAREAAREREDGAREGPVAMASTSVLSLSRCYQWRSQKGEPGRRPGKTEAGERRDGTHGIRGGKALQRQ